MKFRFWGPMRYADALEGRLDIDLLDGRGVGPLHWSVCKEDVENFDRLLAFGANPNLRCSTQRTPLHFAMHAATTHFAEALLTAGADPDAADRNKQTPIFEAIDADNVAAVRLLLKHGANTAVVARGRATPYGTALLLSRLEIAEILQDLPVSGTRTPTDWLHVAACEKLWQIIPHLIKRGAKVNERDKDGRTALEMAAFDPLSPWPDRGPGYAEYQGKIQRTVEVIETAGKFSHHSQAAIR